MSNTEKKIPSRLLSLDVMRGITIAGMILVNNPGDWKTIFAPLRHAEWNGLTPTDLVFPFFIFIMGVSMFLSYKKFDFRFSTQTFTKLLRRTVLLFLIGVALCWFNIFCWSLRSPDLAELPLIEKILRAANNFDHLRILGVLQRLALVSFFGTLTVLFVRPRLIPWLIALILLAYWIIIGTTGSYNLDTNNLVGIIDRAVLGELHMYSFALPDGSPIAFDPEGILSTLPCLAQVLLGFLAGKIISETKTHAEKIQKLFLLGTVILFAGFLLNYGFPINKKIWSSSFVLVTCGMGSLLLGLLIWIIDIKGKKSWSSFFESFGVNPLFIYVLAGIFAALANLIGFQHYGQWISLKGFIYTQWLLPVFGDYLGSLAYAVMFVCLNWMIGHLLYKKKIYIKL